VAPGIGAGRHFLLHPRGELAALFAPMDVPHPEEEVIPYFPDLSGWKRFWTSLARTFFPKQFQIPVPGRSPHA
jgi:hypothetical protein